MKVESFLNISEHAKDILILPLIKNDKAQSAQIKKVEELLGFKLASELKRREFLWKAGSSVVIDTPATKNIKALVIFCWAHANDKSQGKFNWLNQYRKLGALAFKNAHCYKCKTASLISSQLELNNDEQSSALLEGFELANYSFDKYKKVKPRQSITLRLLDSKKSIKPQTISTVRAITQATKLARDLVNLPAKDCTPRFLANNAKQIAKKGRLKVQVLNEQALKKIGANNIIAVSKGSSEEAFLIKLSYTPKKKTTKTIALVGKGVTFDSGGLSIKPADGMMTMKIDMAGAAAVLATMQAIATIKPDVAVHAFMPVTENMINGQAQKPGDIVRAMNGKTIEVLNTDAEGRLILAEALCLAEKDKPNVIIDLATLTGAVVIALGNDYAGLYSTSEKLQSDLQKAADSAGERLWPMPLAEEYESLIKGSISDIRNIGAGRVGGSITAALFLKHFVGSTPWAHLDIAGTAFSEKDSDFIPKGGVGFGVRTLVNYITGQ